MALVEIWWLTDLALGYDFGCSIFAVSSAGNLPSITQSSAECSWSHESSGDCLGFSFFKSSRLVSALAEAWLACWVDRSCCCFFITCTATSYIQNLPGVCSTLHTFLHASDNVVMEVVPCTPETPARHFQLGLGLQYGSSTMMVQLETGVRNKLCYLPSS